MTQVPTSRRVVAWAFAAFIVASWATAQPLPGTGPATLPGAAPSASPGAAVGRPLTPGEQAAIAVHARNSDAMMQVPGVRAVGVGLLDDGRTPGLHVYVDRTAGRPVIASEVEGVGVRQILTRGFVAHNGPCDESLPCHAGAYAKPVPMGVSTGNINGTDAGTLGFRVHRSDDPTLVGYVTNNHVAAATASGCPAQLHPAALTAFNVNQCQPGLYDSPDGTCSLSRRIGKLVQVVPIIMGTQFPNVIDAAFVQSKRGCISKSIRDIGPPAATAAFPSLGDVVYLSGRTSGRLTNKIVTIHATVDVSYPNQCGTARFIGQAMAEPIDSDAASRAGDSGAPVVAQIGNVAMGINFAGDGVLGIVTPMPLVLNGLGVQIDTAADAAPASACL